MRIAITVASLQNHYASLLIARLAQEGLTPACVVASIKKYKRRIFAKAACKMYQGLYAESKAATWPRAPHAPTEKIPLLMQEYARLHYIDAPHTSGLLLDLARQHGFEFKKFDTINGPRAIKYLKSCAIDLIVHMGTEIYQEPVISTPSIGILNAHMGVLPAYRGMNALEWSLFYGTPLGVTTHFISRGIDAGDIVLRKELRVSKEDTTIEGLRTKASLLAVDALLESVVLLRDDKAARITQDPDEGARYFVMHPRLRKIAEHNIRRYKR